MIFGNSQILRSFVLIYWIAMNIAGIIVMGVDKERSRRKQWRIPERTLFLVSLLGGSLGTWAGMYLFRHKTRHWYFVWGMPAILLCHLVLASWLFGK